MSKFNINSKVVVRDGSENDGRTGVIIDTAVYYSWRIRYDDFGNTENFHEKDLELVPDKQWLTYEQAMLLCIQGTPVQHEGQPKDNHIEFNGSSFVGQDERGSTWTSYVQNCKGSRWKVYEAPVSEPKFPNGTFVCEVADGDYWRVLASEYVGGQWKYFVTNNEKDNDVEDAYELSEPSLTMPKLDTSCVKGGN